MKMKALILDTNRGSYPVYKALIKSGWFLTTIGRSEFEPLAKLCPNYVKADYGDNTFLEKFVQGGGFSAVIPGCTDESYLACSRLPRSLTIGIDAVDVVNQLFQKKALRGLVSSLGIPHLRTNYQMHLV